MQWLEITIKTTSAGIDLVAAKLTALGFDSFIMDDQADFQNFLEDNRQYWDYVDEELEKKMQDLSQIRLYVEDDAAAMERVSYLRQELALFRDQCVGTELGSLEISLANTKDEDWENNWKQYYKPIAVGEKLLILPEWLQDEADPSRLPVVLDPGMIFGTGAHASTQMCLRALEKAIRGGERVVDLGSGSGILSIAALVLGAKSAVGVDIDPKAEDIARENAAMNPSCKGKFTALTGDVIGDKNMERRLSAPYDVVLANIVADVIIPLSAVVPRLLAENGIFICSGILDTRLDEVKSALEKNGLRVIEICAQEDWRQLTAVRA